MELKKRNVLLLGAAFHLLFFSFQTSVFIQQTVVNSLRARPEHNFTGDGYVSLCITYAVFALANWLAPSVIAYTGLKYGMFLGALTYAAYAASFIYPTTWLFYASAALIGLGAGLLWTAQGSFLAKQSDAHTSSRNAAIFWSMLQSSILFGNLFVYFAFDTQAAISDKTRYIVYGVLTLVGALGTLVLLLLRDEIKQIGAPEATQTNGRRRGEKDEEEDDDAAQSSAPAQPPLKALEQFLSALKLARTCNMLLLSTAFLFTGQLLSFFTGVYGTAIGATSQFGAHAKRYIGLAGIFIGLGEILGGSVFGLLGPKVSKRLGRDTVFLFGYLVTLAAIALTFLNLPPDSPLASPALRPTIIEPRIWISMVASVLIGLGDACFNTQVYSLLMSVYKSNSVGAFALFKFVQSAGSAVAFLYSTRLDLYWQLLILALISTLATICFCLIEWACRRDASNSTTLGRRTIEKTDSQQSIITSDSLAEPTQVAPHLTSTNASAPTLAPTSTSSERRSSSPPAGSVGPPSRMASRSPLRYIRNMLLGAAGPSGPFSSGKSRTFTPRQVV